MTKTYVLDTSVLLNSGKKALYGFADNQIIIPLGVVKQLESHVKDSEFGWIATNVLRELEKLRTEHAESINAGVPLSNGGQLRIELNHVKRGDLPPAAREASNTLLVAHNLMLDKDANSGEVILVSNDLTQRLAAGALDIKAVPFRRETSQGEYTGINVLYVDQKRYDSFYQNGMLSATEVEESKDHPVRHSYVLKNLEQPSNGALATKGTDGNLYRIKEEDLKGIPISGRSAEQKIALSHLVNPDIDIVSLGGAAGTGKTLLALAAGHYLVGSQKDFNKIIVFRPLQEVGGQELGFLPGTEEEKMLPWTQAIRDALSVWMDANQINREFANGRIEVSPATFIRGRTINNAFIIIDEAQNFERLTLLSILSRLGKGSKCVLSWDAAQRDNLYINKDDGVVAIIDRMKTEPLVAHVTLHKSERSRAAQMATDILDEFELS